MTLDLDVLAGSLCDAHGAHTVILYGSRARGDARATSDVDVFVLRDDGPATSDHRVWEGLWLDAWVHPLAAFTVLAREDGEAHALYAAALHDAHAPVDALVARVCGDDRPASARAPR